MNEIKKGPFFGFSKDMPKGFIKSVKDETGKVKNNSPAVIDALVNYCAGVGFVGKLTIEDMYEETAYVAEYPLSDESAILVSYRKETGAVSAVIATKSAVPGLGTASLSQYSVSTTANDARAIIFAMLPVFTELDYILHGKTFTGHFCDFANALSEGADTLNAPLQDAAYKLSDLVYQKITALTDEIPVKVPSTGNFFVDDDIIADNVVEEVIMGSPKFFTLAEGVTVPEKAATVTAAPTREETLKEFAGSYKISETPDEYKNLIPTLPPYFVVPKEIHTILKHIVATTDDPEPMRNILLRGPSGTGKSEGAKAIANGLGKPFVSVTGSANMELIDILGGMLPNVTGTASVESITLGDVMYAPEEVYKALTGEEKDSVTSEEVFSLLMDAKKSNSPYIYQESDFVRAIRNGWVVEFQEPTAITNPAVLTGLNKILNMAEMNVEGLLLPDNTRLKRHPESVVVFTTNVNYQGCRPMNESVVDRMNLIFDMDMPSKNDLKKRVKLRTGFDDDAMLDKMLKVIDLIDDQLMNCGIRGTCGPRALFDWVRSLMITGDPYESGVLAVVNKAAHEAEDREVIIKCLQSQFAPKGMIA